MYLSQTIGSRCQVMHGTAKKTSGGLTKTQLKYNKQGKIVSCKASALAKKNNRLVKAGYVTRKGVFGVSMRGGGGEPNNVEPLLHIEQSNLLKILVLCANIRSIEALKWLQIINFFFKIELFKDRTLDITFTDSTILSPSGDLSHYSELKKSIESKFPSSIFHFEDTTTRQQVVSLFEDNIYDIIIDEYCPFMVLEQLSSNLFKNSYFITPSFEAHYKDKIVGLLKSHPSYIHSQQYIKYNLLTLDLLIPKNNILQAYLKS